MGPSAAAAGLRRARLEPPAHLAVFYNTDAGRTRVSTPFLAEGLAAGEAVLLLASGEPRDAHLGALRSTPGVDVERALGSGQLKVVDGPGSTVASAIAYWEDGLWSALAGGAQRVRAVSEAESVREGFVSEPEMMAYEAALNLVVPRFPVTAICQYDARRFSGQALLQAMRAHPDLFEQSLGSFLA